MDTDEKLEAFRRWAPAAAGMICDMLETPEELFALYQLATQRHELGSVLYGDKNLMEWDDDRLYEEFKEEVADAIVYGAHWLDRFSKRPTV